MSELEILQRAVSHYGRGDQVLKALEEMTELSYELWRWRKGGSGMESWLETIKMCGEKQHQESITSAIREEIADVRIMLDQLEIMFGDTSGYRADKLERLQKRMGK